MKSATSKGHRSGRARPGQEQQGAANKLREAASGLRQNRVQDRIRATQRLMETNQFDVARQGDQMIQQNLEQLAQQLAGAEKNAQRKGAGGETEDALEKTRKLADKPRINAQAVRRPQPTRQSTHKASRDPRPTRSTRTAGRQTIGNQPKTKTSPTGQQGQRGQQGRQGGPATGQQGRHKDGRSQEGQQGASRHRTAGTARATVTGGWTGRRQPTNAQPAKRSANRGGGPPQGYDRRQLGSELREICARPKTYAATWAGIAIGKQPRSRRFKVCGAPTTRSCATTCRPRCY